MTPAAVIALACVKHRRAPLLAGAVQYARSSLVSMQKQTSPSREADNDVRDALESIVLQIEGPEEPRDTKVVSDTGPHSCSIALSTPCLSALCLSTL